MTTLQDVFWSAFADEAEKLAGLGSKALIAGGTVGALVAAGSKATDDAKATVSKADTKQRSRLAKQTGEDY